MFIHWQRNQLQQTQPNQLKHNKTRQVRQMKSNKTQEDPHKEKQEKNSPGFGEVAFEATSPDPKTSIKRKKLEKNRDGWGSAEVALPPTSHDPKPLKRKTPPNNKTNKQRKPKERKGFIRWGPLWGPPDRRVAARPCKPKQKNKTLQTKQKVLENKHF